MLEREKEGKEEKENKIMEQPQKEKRIRIPKSTAMLMVTVALFFDGLQALLNFLLIGLVLNWAIDILAFLLFWLWFKMRGVSLGDSVKKLAAWAAAYAIKSGTGNFAPTLFISTLITIAIVRADDALYNKGIETNLTGEKSQNPMTRRGKIARQIEAQTQNAPERGSGDDFVPEPEQKTRIPLQPITFKSPVIARAAANDPLFNQRYAQKRAA